MLQSFIITLREGVEAALIVGIVLAYLHKTGRNHLRRPVFIGLGAAIVASVLVAVLLARTGFNQEAFEGYVMLAASVFVIGMVWFMMKAGRTMKTHIESRVAALANSSIGLFLFVFLMVLREGVETVLILSAISLSTSDLLSFLGTLAGILVAVVFGYMFVQGSVRIQLQKFFRVTSVILIFVALQLIISGLHELSESGVIPATRESMALIGPIVRNDVFFFICIMALAALMSLLEYRRRAPAPALAGATAADLRKAEWSARRERLWMAGVYGTSFIFIVLVTAQFIHAKSTTSLSPAEPLPVRDGKVLVPMSRISGGDLHRYVATIDGRDYRFFLMRRPDDVVVAVMDACEICGDVGFAQSPNGILCANCSAPVNPQTLGQSGGCNPIPLDSAVSGDTLSIAAASLVQAASRTGGHH